MSATLLPCPFCGADPVMQEIEPHSHGGGIAGFMPDYPGSFTIECPSECCCGMINDTLEQVTAAWNRRAASPAVYPCRPATDRLESSMSADIKTWQERARGSGFGNASHASHMQDEIAELRAVLAQPAQAAAPVDERAAFEAWLEDSGYPIDVIRLDLTADGEYLDSDYAYMWEAWQARAAFAHPVAASQDQLDAARWREVLLHVGADTGLTRDRRQRFTLRHLAPGCNLMKGCVAGHLTKAIDASIAAKGEA